MSLMKNSVNYVRCRLHTLHQVLQYMYCKKKSPSSYTVDNGKTSMKVKVFQTKKHVELQLKKKKEKTPAVPGRAMLNIQPNLSH